MYIVSYICIYVSTREHWDCTTLQYVCIGCGEAVSCTQMSNVDTIVMSTGRGIDTLKKKETLHVKTYNLLQIVNIILNTEISITLHWNLAHCFLTNVQTLKFNKMSKYHIKVHSVQKTSLQSQYMLCPPLACNTAWTHRQLKITTSEYATWETGPWQQEIQYQMSQVSDEYRHRQSETVSVKTASAPDVFTLAQYWDVSIDLQESDGVTE